MINENTFKTRDLGEAGALLIQKQELLAVQRDGQICWFIFKDQKLCEDISRKFFFGILEVNAREYKEILDRLKNRIFASI